MSIEELQAENARLKAEVEELKRQPDPLTAYLYAAELGKDAIKKLKAEVKRLRKAGDDLCSTMEANGIHDNGDFEMHEKAIAQWNAAKEGKPSV